jgi:hypothetical protein
MKINIYGVVILIIFLYFNLHLICNFNTERKFSVAVVTS